jgi:Spy/CpxP family protein refolding chaperone
MKKLNAIKFIATNALIIWAIPAFSQHMGLHHSMQAAPVVTASPYAGEQAREIKSLSASDISALQAGAGMAYAKAAELNGYPGPMHVLELAAPLRLSMDQREATEKLMTQHKTKVRALGAQFIDAERALDAAFASKQVDAQIITALTQRIATVQATLRAEHLRTHLQQTALLDEQQIASYKTLRGYDQPAGQPNHQHKH